MSKGLKKVFVPAVAVVLALLLCCAGAWPAVFSSNKAYAVINLGALSMSMSSKVQVAAGGTVNVSCVVTPGSSSQMPNCEMDYCPSGCDAHPIAGGSNGCQDASGQCTCNGGGYTTYYPQVSVYSDNPGVARGTWSGNTLTIAGYAPGTAHISATSSMRLFTPASQSITVTVAESGSSSGGGDGAGAGAGAGAGGAGGTYVAPKPSAGAPADGSASAPVVSPSAGASAPVVVSSTGGGAESPEQAAAAAQVVQLVTEASGGAPADEVAAEGGQTTVAALDDAATSVRELLSQIVDTVNQVMFWAGSNEEVPDYVWSAQGSKMKGAPEHDIDLTVRDVTVSESELADALSGRTYMALDAKACGRLPGELTLTYRVADVFATGSYVNVYTYDAEAGTLARVQRNVAVTDGYVSVPVSEGALLVISDDDDLASVAVGAASATTAAADATATDARSDGEGGNGGVPVGVIAAVVAAAVVVLAAVGAVMYARWRKNVAAAGVDADAAVVDATDATAKDGLR